MNAIDDARFALRLARRFPLFTTIVTLTIALGIGSTTTIFSVVDAVVLRPLPFPDGDRLVSLWGTNPDRSIPRFAVSYPDFKDWATRTHSFSSMALYASGMTTLKGNGEPESVAGLYVTSNFFDVLGIHAIRGRDFGADDEHGESSNAVILSYGFWKRRFGGDASVIGSSIAVSGRSRTIIGILPPEADVLGPAFVGAPLDVVSVIEPSTYPSVERHAQHLFVAVARLKPGATLAQARADLSAVEAQVAAENPEIAGWTASVFPLTEDFSLGTKGPVLILLAASIMLLLIACINVANLLVVRGATRAREIASRQALGASRSRLVGQFLMESLVLAFAGAIPGVALSVLAQRALRALIPFGVIIRADDIGLDGRVLLFALALTILTALGFGLMPALRVTGGRVSETLRAGRTDTGDVRSRRFRRGLVIAEVAIAVVLMVCSGLVWQSLTRLLRVDPGFRPEHTVTAQITLGKEYPDSSSVAFWRTLLTNLDSKGGIEAAGATDTPPLSGGRIFTSIRLLDQPPRPADQPLMSTIRSITPGYFAAMGIRVQAGHDLEWNESGPSMVVNAAAAKAFWPGQPVTDKQIAFHQEPNGNPVVGEVNDTHEASLATPPAPVVYVSMRRYQRVFRTMTLVVRGRGDVASLTQTIRTALHEVDPGLPLYKVQSLQAIVVQSTAQTRLDTLLLVLFGVTALLLAALGIYGVVSYSVMQRRQEMGVRLALGAAPRGLLGLVIGEGVALTTIGVAVGALSASFTTKLVQSLLFGVGPGDPVTFAAVALGLVGVATLASLIPARRAMRIDPIIALRGE